MSQTFDFNRAPMQLRAGKDLTGKDGVLMPLIKQLTEVAITAELETHIANSDEPNRKNGAGSKTIKTGSVSFELNAPRDRAGSFEPQPMVLRRRLWKINIIRPFHLVQRNQISMDIEKHYGQVSGVNTPWQFSQVELNMQEQRVDIEIEYGDNKGPCPECGTLCPKYDDRDRRT